MQYLLIVCCLLDCWSCNSNDCSGCDKCDWFALFLIKRSGSATEGVTDCRLTKPKIKKYMVTEGLASVEQGL